MIARWMRLELENLGVDSEDRDAGNVDLPGAVEIVWVPAIVEAGRSDDSIVSDLAAADDSRRAGILVEIAIFSWRGENAREDAAGDLKKRLTCAEKLSRAEKLSLKRRSLSFRVNLKRYT